MKNNYVYKVIETTEELASLICCKAVIIKRNYKCKDSSTFIYIEPHSISEFGINKISTYQICASNSESTQDQKLLIRLLLEEKGALLFGAVCIF